MTKEILDCNVCQVTETESTVVFLQSCDSIGEQKEISVLRVYVKGVVHLFNVAHIGSPHKANYHSLQAVHEVWP